MTAMSDPAGLREGRVNILLVDDRPQNLLALEAVLKPLRQNLVRATSGEEALKLLLKDDYAVILLDVQMPGLDGFQTAEYIKQVERTRHIPIIFLTAISKDARHVFHGYSVGAVDYLLKPFDPVILRSKVAVFIDLHQKTAALRESEERFRRAFDDAPIGVGLVGQDGEWLKVNRALCQILGYSESQFLSMRLEDVLHAADPGIDLQELATRLGGDMRAYHLEKLFVHQSGDTVHGLVSIALVDATHADVPYFVLQLNDITDRKQLEMFRDRFIGHAAHELRTPVSVLKGTAELLRDWSEMSPEDLERCLAVVDRQSFRLTALVESLLDLSRLQEGRFTAELEPVALGPFVRELIENVPPPDGKSVSVTIDDDAVALADRNGLDQIVTNLLVNAYKYGGPNVSVGSEPTNGRLRLSVADDGPGIPEELVPRLFEPFTRGGSSAVVQGSGLGLALVRNLAEVSGADVFYDSGASDGSRFVVSLRVPDDD